MSCVCLACACMHACIYVCVLGLCVDDDKFIACYSLYLYYTSSYVHVHIQSCVCVHAYLYDVYVHSLLLRVQMLCVDYDKVLACVSLYLSYDLRLRVFFVRMYVCLLAHVYVLCVHVLACMCVFVCVVFMFVAIYL